MLVPPAPGRVQRARPARGRGRAPPRPQRSCVRSAARRAADDRRPRSRRSRSEAEALLPRRGLPRQRWRSRAPSISSYAGQSFELTVPLPAGADRRRARATLAAELRRASTSAPTATRRRAIPIQIVNLRLDRARAPAGGRPRRPARSERPRRPRAARGAPTSGRRTDARRRPSLGRADLDASAAAGPAADRRVRRDHARPAGCAARLDAHGNIVIATGASADDRAADLAIPIRSSWSRTPSTRSSTRWRSRSCAPPTRTISRTRWTCRARSATREGRLIAQGLTLPLHLGSIPDAMARGAAQVRRHDPARRRVHPERPVRGRHAPARLLHLQADLRRRRRSSAGRRASATSPTSAARRRAATAATRPRSTRRGCASRRSGSTTRGEPVEARVRAHRQERARAAPGAGRRARPGRRLPHRRARLPRSWSRSTARERFAACTDALLDQAERLARNAIAAMPDGTYEFTDYIDDDGIDPDPIPIVVTITVAGDHLHRRLHRLGAAGEAARINSPLPFTKSAVYACVRHLIGGDPPNNEGYFRPIEVVAPPGTIVNPVLPAAGRRARPDRLPHRQRRLRRAGADRARPRPRLRGRAATPASASAATTPSGRPFVFLEFLFGSWGGRPDPGRHRRLQQLGRQLLEQPDRGDRGRVPAADRALRLSARHRRRRPVPRRARAGPRSTASWRREGTLQLRTDRRTHLPVRPRRAAARARRRETS